MNKFSSLGKGRGSLLDMQARTGCPCSSPWAGWRLSVALCGFIK